MNFGLDVSSINAQDCEGIRVKAGEFNDKKSGVALDGGE
jgi:hypothetical protein